MGAGKTLFPLEESKTSIAWVRRVLLSSVLTTVPGNIMRASSLTLACVLFGIGAANLALLANAGHVPPTLFVEKPRHLAPATAAFLLQPKDGHIVTLPPLVDHNPQHLGIGVTKRNPDNFVALWFDGNIASLWRLQTNANRRVVEDAFRSAVDRLSTTLAALPRTARFQTYYRPRIQALLEDKFRHDFSVLSSSDQNILFSAVREEFDGFFSGSFANTFLQRFFEGIEPQAIIGLLAQVNGRKSVGLTNLALNATLDDPAIQQQIKTRLLRLLTRPDVQATSTRATVAIFNDLRADPDVRSLIIDILNDPAFSPILSEVGDTFADFGRTSVPTLLAIDGRAPAIHPLAAEIIKTLIDGRPRGFVVLISERRWNALEPRYRRHLTLLDTLRRSP